VTGRGPELHTERLRLRRWLPSDRAPFAALNADPLVMEFFPSTLTRAESDGIADRIEALFDEQGFGLWAVEVPGVVRFAGFVGLAVPRFTAHFTPCVEVGWRLAREHWGHGYATEAARASVAFAFESCHLAEVVALAVAGNTRSRRVMERIGMTYDPSDDFDHPMLDLADPLCRHVLYRIRPGMTVAPGAIPR
jgi:RimJ/RimL family protein N-acetyltransferase